MRSAKFWHDKHVIITGASSGIGWALAEHLAQYGPRLGLLARRREPLERLAGVVRSSGATAAVAVADVRDAVPTRDAIGSLEAALGPCDVLIANAGVLRYSPGDNFDVTTANEVITTNVQGVINSIGPVLPAMVARRSGYLVAVASIAAMLGLPESAAYAASKVAVVHLMQSLRADLHTYGVRVTAVCPGFVETPMISGRPDGTLFWVLSARRCAQRIARAVERGRHEYWFPRRTWLLARVVRALPTSLYHAIVRRLPRRSPPRMPKE